MYSCEPDAGLTITLHIVNRRAVEELTNRPPPTEAKSITKHWRQELMPGRIPSIK